MKTIILLKSAVGGICESLGCHGDSTRSEIRTPERNIIAGVIDSREHNIVCNNCDTYPVSRDAMVTYSADRCATGKAGGTVIGRGSVKGDGQSSTVDISWFGSSRFDLSDGYIDNPDDAMRDWTITLDFQIELGKITQDVIIMTDSRVVGSTHQDWHQFHSLGDLFRRNPLPVKWIKSKKKYSPPEGKGRRKVETKEADAENAEEDIWGSSFLQLSISDDSEGDSLAMRKGSDDVSLTKKIPTEVPHQDVIGRVATDDTWDFSLKFGVRGPLRNPGKLKANSIIVHRMSVTLNALNVFKDNQRTDSKRWGRNVRGELPYSDGNYIVDMTNILPVELQVLLVDDDSEYRVGNIIGCVIASAQPQHGSMQPQASDALRRLAIAHRGISPKDLVKTGPTIRLRTPFTRKEGYADAIGLSEQKINGENSELPGFSFSTWVVLFVLVATIFIMGIVCLHLLAQGWRDEFLISAAEERLPNFDQAHRALDERKVITDLLKDGRYGTSRFIGTGGLICRDAAGNPMTGRLVSDDLEGTFLTNTIVPGRYNEVFVPPEPVYHEYHPPRPGRYKEVFVPPVPPEPVYHEYHPPRVRRSPQANQSKYTLNDNTDN